MACLIEILQERWHLHNIPILDTSYKLGVNRQCGR